MNKKPIFDYPFFVMGFRTFFSLAALSALLLIVLWNSIYNGALHTANYFPSNYWHAHEMLLGYSTAVIAGFLLTAVRNWTGRATTTPDQLAGLGILWLYGRITPFYAGLLPDFLIALVDVAFLPCLAWAITRPLLATKNYRNLIFTVMLLVMTVANILIHAEVLELTENTAWTGLNTVLAVIMVMILVLAGRVFPFFTERGLKGVIAIRNPLLEKLGILSTIMTFILVLGDIKGLLLALSAITALLINTARALGWYDRKVWYVPLLWVLYIGYGWIMLGFVLLALSAYSLVPYALALHAFTVGGIGVITLGMMARVSLGHTGRALKASNVMALAFVLINLAALFRVLLPTVMPDWYGQMVLASSYFWLAAFSLFVFYYGPILVAPRADGREG